MKAFTDLEQSKKLAEILPPESADMHYSTWTILDGEFIVSPNQGQTIEELQEDYGNQIIPCWSLASLMEILNGAAFTRAGTAPEYYEATIFYTDEAPKLKRMTCTGTSYVDACYKMIMKLHEMNILTLPKTMEEQS